MTISDPPGDAPAAPKSLFDELVPAEAQAAASNSDLPSVGDLGQALSDHGQPASKPEKQAASDGTLETILEQAARKARETGSQMPKGALSPKAAQFFESFRLTKEHLGKTPAEILDDLESPDENEPNDYDEEILDQILAENCYRKAFQIGKIDFSIATYSNSVVQHAMRTARKAMADDPGGFDQAFNAAAVARSLETYAGDLICDVDASDRKFGDKDQFAKRYEFCMGLPSVVLDAIGTRTNMFDKRTQSALARNLSTF